MTRLLLTLFLAAGSTPIFGAQDAASSAEDARRLRWDRLRAGAPAGILVLLMAALGALARRRRRAPSTPPA